MLRLTDRQAREAECHPSVGGASARGLRRVLLPAYLQSSGMNTHFFVRAKHRSRVQLSPSSQSSVETHSQFDSSTAQCPSVQDVRKQSGVRGPRQSASVAQAGPVEVAFSGRGERPGATGLGLGSPTRASDTVRGARGVEAPGAGAAAKAGSCGSSPASRQAKNPATAASSANIAP